MIICCPVTPTLALVQVGRNGFRSGGMPTAGV